MGDVLAIVSIVGHQAETIVYLTTDPGQVLKFLDDCNHVCEIHAITGQYYGRKTLIWVHLTLDGNPHMFAELFNLENIGSTPPSSPIVL